MVVQVEELAKQARDLAKISPDHDFQCLARLVADLADHLVHMKDNLQTQINYLAERNKKHETL